MSFSRQSDGDEEVHGGGRDKRSILLSESVEILITCITPPTGAAPRFYPYQNWGYNEAHRIRIENVGDRFCLFYALIASKAVQDCFGSRYEELNRLLSNRTRMSDQVAALMNAAGISKELDTYGLEHIDTVQRLWVC